MLSRCCASSCVNASIHSVKVSYDWLQTDEKAHAQTHSHTHTISYTHQRHTYVGDREKWHAGASERMRKEKNAYTYIHATHLHTTKRLKKCARDIESKSHACERYTVDTHRTSSLRQVTGWVSIGITLYVLSFVRCVSVRRRRRRRRGWAEKYEKCSRH